jgi:gluconate 2-dehydrogenase gamma chain
MSESRVISRRDLLRSAGAAVGAAAIAGDRTVTDIEAAQVQPAPPVAAPVATHSHVREAYESLTAAEADTLEAIVARLIPADANGPGAIEARAPHYIDRALAGALAASREDYRAGFAAFDRYCRASRGKPFVELSPTDQDSVLIDVESGAATGSGAGFVGSSAIFFNMVKAHTWQGTFGDPYYGGNANFIGWDLVGYPGVRTMVTAADQTRLEHNELPANHRSAYDFEGFNKATAQQSSPAESKHGD